MTLRKYKKMLMSFGFDRNQAEDDRQQLAKWRRLAAKDGVDPAILLYYGDLDAIVAFRKKWGTHTYRGRIKHQKEMLKNVTVV